jgi:hypothetical protein
MFRHPLIRGCEAADLVWRADAHSAREARSPTRRGFGTLAVSVPGSALRLPDDLVGNFGVILFCPYCNAQLSAFQRSLKRLADIGARVAALSVDDEATTQDLIAKHGPHLTDRPSVRPSASGEAGA